MSSSAKLVCSNLRARSRTGCGHASGPICYLHSTYPFLNCLCWQPLTRGRYGPQLLLTMLSCLKKWLSEGGVAIEIIRWQRGSFSSLQSLRTWNLAELIVTQDQDVADAEWRFPADRELVCQPSNSNDSRFIRIFHGKTAESPSKIRGDRVRVHEMDFSVCSWSDLEDCIVAQVLAAYACMTLNNRLVYAKPTLHILLVSPFPMHLYTSCGRLPTGLIG